MKKLLTFFAIILATGLALAPSSADAQVKISAMTTGSEQDSLMFVTVWDSSGTMVSRKIYWTDLRDNLDVKQTMSVSDASGDTLVKFIENEVIFNPQDVSVGVRIGQDYADAAANLTVWGDTGGGASIEQVVVGDLTSGPRFDIIFEDPTPDASEVIGIINFKADDSAGGTRSVFANIQAQTRTIAAGLEDGFLDVRVAVNGIPLPIIEGDGATQKIQINPDGHDLDFEVLGDGGAVEFSVDAGTDKVKYERHDDLAAVGWFPLNTAVYDTVNGVEVVVVASDSFTFDWKAPEHFSSILGVDFIFDTNGSATGDSSGWFLRFNESVVTHQAGNINATFTSLADTIEHSTTATNFQVATFSSGMSGIAANEKVTWKLVRDRTIAQDEANSMRWWKAIVRWE